ncbi:hypothetical protein DAI22_12g086700 [Oryza sativa Japonica Group]|nr:hypothetical protein DAI22_12g086700 [Oryza sativa Japonica Group]
MSTAHPRHIITLVGTAYRFHRAMTPPPRDYYAARYSRPAPRGSAAALAPPRSARFSAVVTLQCRTSALPAAAPPTTLQTVGPSSPPRHHRPLRFPSASAPREARRCR